jgi:class 3 adenylate cyclase/ActR/RegA family two-component response regulator
MADRPTPPSEGTDKPAHATLDPGHARVLSVIPKLRHDLRTPLNQIIGYTEMLQEVAGADLQPDLDKVRAAALNLVSGIDRAMKVVADAMSGDTPEPSPVSLPMPPSMARPALPEEAERHLSSGEGDAGETLASADLRGARILIVDDSEANRSMLSRRLVRRGVAVDTAESGEQALEILGTRTFDLVLLDVVMPGLSGIDVLRIVREKVSMSELPIIMATARDASGDVVEALALGANDYVTKPIDLPVLLARANTQLSLKFANERVRELAVQLETRNKFIRETFGRYLTDEVVENLLATPDGLALGGASRKVTILMSDLRGFSSMSERLTPTQVVGMLNNYLGTMTEIIHTHGGTIDEFIGDAILVIFGAPVAHADAAERAVACALDMELAMTEVNAFNRASGLPELEMGIGINTGEVVVGNIGSHRRAKYGVVGRNVNLASRIEAYTVGGQVLISESTREDVGPILRIDGRLEMSPKGAPAPMTIYDVGGISGTRNLQLPQRHSTLVPLDEPIPIYLAVMNGVHAPTELSPGAIHALSRKAALVVTDVDIATMSTLKVHFVGPGGAPSSADLYGKVLRADEGQGFLLHFTSVAPELRAHLDVLRGGGARPEA